MKLQEQAINQGKNSMAMEGGEGAANSTAAVLNVYSSNGAGGSGRGAADQDSSPDDEMKSLSSLVVTDSEHDPWILQGLAKLRRNRQFCDVILQVGTHEIPAHRAILACASPYLFELFSKDDSGKCSEENVITYKLNGGFEKESLERLVNYAYTGRLEVPASLVKSVFAAGSRLKMERAVAHCARFLVNHLDPATAVDIRSMYGIQKHPELAARVDNYLAAHVTAVANTKAMHALPLIQAEVLASSKEDMENREANMDTLCSLVLDWIKRQWEQGDLSFDRLVAKTHMLYMNPDNSLHDCTDIEHGDLNDSDIVQDYKKMSQRVSQPHNKNRRKSSGQQQPSRPRHSLYSRSISELLTASGAENEALEWKLIATLPVGGSTLALCVVSGKLATLSVLQRFNVNHAVIEAAGSSPQSTPGQSRTPSVERSADTVLAVPHMSTARCAVGCANLNNTLLVCGGYDRGECLRTVEAYDPCINCWTQLPSMREARGRFDITVIDGKVYAVGGCNGTTELATMEVFNSERNTWTTLPPLPLARSNVGVCDLNGKVYCIGGWNGQSGMRQCDMFDPATNQWASIAPLNHGRYQAGVTAHSNKVFAVGGCDAWNCLSSIEVYDPVENQWNFLPPMITARRGCGVAVFNNKLFIVGGSDGCQALCSTEVFDFETLTWSPGPSMTTCRANISVAVIDNKIFAVGGFSGKAFLNSIEYLDPDTMEWTTFVNRSKDERKNGSSRRTSSQSNNLSPVDESAEANVSPFNTDSEFNKEDSF